MAGRSNGVSPSPDPKLKGWFPPEQNMEAFDALPKDLRDFVNYFPFDMNPLIVVRVYNHYQDSNKVKEAILARAKQEGWIK